MTLGRIDAGVDLDRPQHFWIAALGACTCYQYDPPGTRRWGGLGAAYFELDHPLTWARRTWRYWYAAEAGHYVVRLGEHFHAGQSVAFTSSGWTEVGFYAGQDMNSQVPTAEGEAFHSLIVALRAGRRV